MAPAHLPGPPPHPPQRHFEGYRLRRAHRAHVATGYTGGLAGGGGDCHRRVLQVGIGGNYPTPPLLSNVVLTHPAPVLIFSRPPPF